MRKERIMKIKLSLVLCVNLASLWYLAVWSNTSLDFAVREFLVFKFSFSGSGV
jgi:4-amino-4-deoxy-L-arabinose transferase-like glycosyltransferase